MAVSARMKRSINCVGIIIDDSDNGYMGRMTYRYSKESLKFRDLPELLNLIEEVLDELNYPSVKIRKRSFKNTPEYIKRIEIKDADALVVDTENLIGTEDGFILMVTGRDNAAMQGSIYNSRLDKVFDFDGDVELMRLINY